MRKFICGFLLVDLFVFLVTFTLTYISNKNSINSALQGQKVISQNNSFAKVLGSEKTNSVKNDKIRQSQINKFLDRLLAAKKESLAEFEENRKKSQTLLAAVSEQLLSPTPTLNPKLERILAAADQQLNQIEKLPDENLALRQSSGFTPRVHPEGQAINNTGNLIENPIKTTYVLAILGDSMVDTLGSDLPHLKDALKIAYPNYSFALLNYGQGATDLESGLKRLTTGTNYNGKYYPPLLSYQPDILVVESFAYNHWSGEKHDLDRQWLAFAKIVDAVKLTSADTKIIFAATIAPNSQVVGDGVFNWSKAKKSDYALVTKAYLQNLVNFATSQNYPLANAYSPSLDSSGEGKTEFIDPSTHLHPSEEGARLFAQMLVETIQQHKLIE